MKKKKSRYRSSLSCKARNKVTRVYKRNNQQQHERGSVHFNAWVQLWTQYHVNSAWRRHCSLVVGATEIRRSRFQGQRQTQVEFHPSSTWFNVSAALVNSQLVWLWSAEILNRCNVYFVVLCIVFVCNVCIKDCMHLTVTSKAYNTLVITFIRCFCLVWI